MKLYYLAFCVVLTGCSEMPLKEFFEGWTFSIGTPDPCHVTVQNGEITNEQCTEGLDHPPTAAEEDVL